MSTLVLVWLGKFVGVTEYDLPLAVLSPVGLGAAKRPRVPAITDVSGHVLQIDCEGKILADRGDDVRLRVTRAPKGFRPIFNEFAESRLTHRYELLPRRVHHPILSVCERRRGSLRLASGTRFGDACSARVAAETGLVGVIMVGM